MSLKRIGIWVAGAVVLGAAAGSIAWFVGRGSVETRIAEVVADADAQGWTISHGPPEIGGFPFGYDIVLPDAAAVRRENGLIARFPRLNIVWDGAEADKLTLVLPPEFDITVPIAEAQRAQDPELPTQLKMKGEATGLQVTMDRATGGTGSWRGETLRLLVDQQDYPNMMDLLLTDLYAELSPGRDGPASLTAAELVAKVRAAPADGPTSILETTVQGVEVDLDRGEKPFREILYQGAQGTVSVSYRFAGAEGQIEIADDPLKMDGTLAFSSGEGAGNAIIATGTLDLTSESQSVSWTATGPDQAWGTVSAARAHFGYTVPTAPTETPLPGRLKVGLEAVEGGEDFWAVLDPGGKLDRAPGNLALDLGITLRLMARLDRLPPGLAPPYEIANVMVNQAYVEALGASFDAAGDVEMIQPVMIPEGRIDIRGQGWKKLITGLAEAGFLTAEMQEMGEAILQVYARPAEGEDNWQSELRIGQHGLSVNGLPVQ